MILGICLISSIALADIDINYLANRYTRPEELGWWIVSHIWYDYDKLKNDDRHWQTAEETLKRRKGVCRDFSVLAYEILELQGYSPFIIVYNTIKGRHAICAFQYKNQWTYISTDGYNLLDWTQLKNYIITDTKGNKMNFLMIKMMIPE